MGQWRLLVVEDEVDSANVVEMILNAAQIDTDVTSNAEDALDRVLSHPDKYAAIIIDLALPGMDGFALMKAIRATASVKHLRLVAVTAFHTPELRSRAIKAGFDAYVPKPLDTTLFVGTLERLLNQST
ncbi:MAG: response regulator [Chloroflexota bacterium]|nr:MAG: response regulator [Chloroflexota bacterium]